MSDKIEAVLIGAGQRGMNDYGPYAQQHPDELNFIAVAEPVKDRRERFAQQHSITEEFSFESWENILDHDRMGQAAFICTQDQMHTQPAIAALNKGYHVLLEKPMATTSEECRLIVDIAEQTDHQLHICHVLRFTKHYQTMREIIQSGVLGQIVNVDYRENVSYWHMAHSYVRGNWASEAKSCPMIIAKCCHDFDILLWMLDDHCLQLSSIGNLLHFRRDNAPAGAPERCLEGCPASETCPYYAPFVYIDLIPLWRTVADTSTGATHQIMRTQLRSPNLIRHLGRLFPLLRSVSDYHGWPRSVLTEQPSEEALLEALQVGPYGRCVYHCDNDVVDHQVVMMEFRSGTSITLTMHGHSHIECRTTRIEGSLGSLNAMFSFGGSWIEVQEHRSNQKTRHNTSSSLQDGHGGGDHGLVEAFIRSLQEEKTEEAKVTARQALESHLLAFTAEEARITGKMVDFFG